MSNRAKVPLGELIHQDIEPTRVHADRVYPNFGIYSFGRGLFRKPPVSGATTSAKTLYQVKSGQFIYSRLFAFEGAYGVVGEEFDGSFISNEYPHFSCDPKKIRADYLATYFRWKVAWQRAAKLSTGMGDRRRRIQPEQLLKMRIPVPPLLEQERIVEWIDAVAARVGKAKHLRADVDSQQIQLLTAMAHRNDLSPDQRVREGWEEVVLGDLFKLSLDIVQVESTESYPNLGLYSFGRGLFSKPPINGMATSAANLTRVHEGQFIYSRLFAFEGAYGIVTNEFDGCFVSNEYPTFTLDSNRVRPEFLAAYFRTPRIWKEIAMGSKGLGGRRQRVQPRQIREHRLMLPPLSWQNRIADVYSALISQKTRCTEIATATNSLLPSVLNDVFRDDREEDSRVT